MNTTLLLLAWCMPLLLVLSGLYRHVRWLTAASLAPAALAWLLVPTGEFSALPWLLLGTELGIDPINRWLLPAAILVWAGASIYRASVAPTGQPGSTFELFFLLAMAGNLLLLLAQDMVSFYAGFALMGLSGFALINNPRSLGASRASYNYLGWTIAGELLLFSGLVALASQAGGTNFSQLAGATPPPLGLLLLVLGFGIKIALPGLHAWMPGSYAAACAPGSAVLGGAMVNAGILGLLRFMPIDPTAEQPAAEAALQTASLAGQQEIGYLLLVLGLLGAFYGLVFGLLQRRPKVLLAYSSISQMGTMASAIGLAMVSPDLGPALLAAVVIYAAHHGLAKGGLFLALDLYRSARFRSWALLALALFSLALAGAPFSSGAFAKGLLKGALETQHSWLATTWFIASIGTTVLMVRFIHLLRSRHAADPPAHLAAPNWTAPAAIMSLLLIAQLAVMLANESPGPGSAWPLLLGGALVYAWTRIPPGRRQVRLPTIPRGDLPVLAVHALRRAWAGCGLARRFKRMTNELPKPGAGAP